jgi:effector-binding domain-containing protein
MTDPRATTSQAAGLERRELLPQVTVGVLMTLGFDELADAFREQLPRIAAQVNELGGTITGPTYGRYHEVGEDRVRLEIGVPVGAPVAGLRPLAEADDVEIGLSELPAGPAAVLTHVGPYDELRHSWARLDGLLAEAGLTRSSPAWESYVDDPDEAPPERMRTEIIVPLS